VAKTRAQRKAERRAREEQQRRQQGGGDPAADEVRAQQDTQLGVSGEVAEFEAAIDTQQNIPDDGAPIGSAGPSADTVAPGIPGVTGDTPQPVPPTPAAPAPSRADAPPPAKEKKPTRREQRRLKKEAEDKAKRQAESEARLRKTKPEAAPERRRGGVMAFFASCWAELKRVQWPDRDTLVQASAVTLIFVAVLAAYLGALDAVFNFLIKRII
jgi:preprotein translocase subunit SecE